MGADFAREADDTVTGFPRCNSLISVYRKLAMQIAVLEMFHPRPVHTNTFAGKPVHCGELWSVSPIRPSQTRPKGFAGAKDRRQILDGKAPSSPYRDN
jgi:hypothetical protein